MFQLLFRQTIHQQHFRSPAILKGYQVKDCEKTTTRHVKTLHRLKKEKLVNSHNKKLKIKTSLTDNLLGKIQIRNK